MKKILFTTLPVLALGVMSTQAAITYVDATTSNTTLANGNPLTVDGSGQNWLLRTGLATNGGTIYQADGPDSSPVIKTTIALADGTYDLFAYYWDIVDPTSSGQWNLAAGKTSGALSEWGGDTTNGQAPIAVAGDFGTAPTLHIDGATANFNQDLYQISLGEVDVTGGSVDIFIDHVYSPHDRSWYDGVGYQSVPVPEPSSTALLGLGGLALILRRRRK